MTKTKRIISAFTILVMLFGMLQTGVFAEDLTEGDFKYSVSKWNNVDKATITGFTDEALAKVEAGTLTEINIPASIGGYPVTMVGSEAFYSSSKSQPANNSTDDALDKITKVTLPDGLTKIGAKTFTGIKGLAEIDIPASVISIGEYAFTNVANANENDGARIIIRGNVTVGDAAFVWTKTEELVLFGSLTADPNGTYGPFNNSDTGTKRYRVSKLYCSDETGTALKTLAEPQLNTGVTYSYSTQWTDVDGTVWDLNTGEEVEVGDISPYTYTQFGDDSSEITITGLTGAAKAKIEEGELTELNIPQTIDGKTVVMIGSKAFYSSVSDLDNKTDDYLDKITKVTLPDGLTKIGARAFTGMKKVRELDIPASVTSIGEFAFTNMMNENAEGYNGGKIVIRGDVEIGNAAFMWTKLEQLVILGDVTVPTSGDVYGPFRNNETRASSWNNIANIYSADAVQSLFNSYKLDTDKAYAGYKSVWYDTVKAEMHILGGTHILRIAKFNGNMLVAVEAPITVTAETTPNPMTFNSDNDGYTKKVFVWDILGNMSPQIPAIEVK